MPTPLAAAEQPLDLAERTLLHANDLDRAAIGRAVESLVGGGDFADLYFEAGQDERWSLRDGKVADASYAQGQGVGARNVDGERTAFAHSGNISTDALTLAIDAVAGMRRQAQDASQSGGIALVGGQSRQRLFGAGNPIEQVDAARKIAVLRDIDSYARGRDAGIVQVSANLSCQQRTVLIADSDGSISADIRPQTLLSVDVQVERGQKRSSGSDSIGGRYGIDDIPRERIEAMVDRAVRRAIVNLDARPSPAGAMSVVLGPGFPGVLLHEAVGHGLEGDAHRTRSSVFADRMGSRIAAEGVTVVDDGTVPGRIGSLHVDDEGTATQRNVLVENGRLVGLMQDRMNAGLMNARRTGNARRESYRHLPMPRMTNTFLEAGSSDPDEIVRSVGNGIYAAAFGGGRVDITSGQFNFSATEAYLIEDGRITAPVEGATLIGMGHEALQHISMVGNDLVIENGVCGKAGQSLQVGVGQPTVRIDEMVVGGTA